MNTSSDKRASLQAALNTIRSDNLLQAQTLLRALLKEYPEDAEVWFVAALATDNRNQQIRILKRSLSLDPAFKPAIQLLDDLETQALLNAIEIEGANSDRNRTAFPEAFPPYYDSSEIPPAQDDSEVIGQPRLLTAFNLRLAIGFVVVLVLAFLYIRQIAGPGTSPTAIALSTSTYLYATEQAPSTLTPAYIPTFSRPVYRVSPPSPTDNIPVLNAPIDPLPYQVVAAAYSNSMDRVIIVSDSPLPALHIYDPEKKTDQTVALPKAPTCLGLSSDGKFAAVGHDGLVSYIDLQAAKLIKTLDLSTVAYSLVVANNGWIYVMPQINFRGDNFHMIQISTNTDKTITVGYNASVYSHEKLILTANGMSFYQVEQDFSPSLIDRDILADDGSISNVDRGSELSVSVGCGDAWLSTGSSRLVSTCGSTYRQSDDPSLDMAYDGRLRNITQVYSAAQSSNTNIIVTVAVPGTSPTIFLNSDTASPYLYFFEYKTLKPDISTEIAPFFKW